MKKILILVSPIALVVVAVLGCILFIFRNGSELRYSDDQLKVTSLTISGVNLYVVERNGKTIMIDSGNPGDEEVVEQLLASEGIEPSSIDYLILTHGHVDHAGTAKYLQSTYGVKIIASRHDAHMFTQGKRDSTCPTRFSARIIKKMKEDIYYPPFQIDLEVDEAFDLAELGIDGKIIPVPGHTPGSFAVVMDHKIFVGDLISGKPFKPNYPSTHFFMCDLEDNRADIKELLKIEHLDEWYLGHFGPLKPTEIKSLYLSKSEI